MKIDREDLYVLIENIIGNGVCELEEIDVTSRKLLKPIWDIITYLKDCQGQLHILNTHFQDLNDKYCDLVEDNVKLRNRILDKSTRISLVLTTCDEHEQNNDYSIATDSVRAMLTDFDIISEKQGVKGAEEEANKHTITPKCVRIGYLNSEFIDPCYHKFEDVKYNVSRCVICGKYEQL